VARVTFELPSLLAPLAGGARRVELEAATLAGALDALCARHPALRAHLFDESGDLRPHVLCLHNGANARWLGPPEERALADGDMLRVLQAVSGG